VTRSIREDAEGERYHEDDVQDYLLGTLAASGYRNTGPRRRLLEWLERQRTPFTAQDIVEAMARAKVPLGRATIFRTLDLLTELGAITQLHRQDGSHTYTVCGMDHHDHFICRICGKVEEVESCIVQPQLERLARSLPMHIEAHRLEFYGRCDACRPRTQRGRVAGADAEGSRAASARAG
jgi:Fur family ferric uptake transcriptional regulator